MAIDRDGYTSLDGSIRPIPVGNRKVGPGQPVFIIAEIGVNHEGDGDLCLRLVEEAAKAGADAIKLQTADPDENYKPGSESYNLYRKAFLSPENTARAFDCAKHHGIEAFTTTGMMTFDWIERLNPAAYKISSSTLYHFPLIRRAAQSGRSVLISTGMSALPDIDRSVEWARRYGAKNLGLFQCTSLYPAPPATLDLAAIGHLKSRYQVPVGYSDHSDGATAASLSVAAGACMIEKHFSLDPGRPSFDHSISLGPKHFSDMVKAVRIAEIMMGSSTKRITPDAEAKSIAMRRYLVARRDIRTGAILHEDDIAVMRLTPGESGLLPESYDDVIGSRARRDIRQWEPIGSDSVETV